MMNKEFTREDGQVIAISHPKTNEKAQEDRRKSAGVNHTAFKQHLLLFYNIF